MTMQFIKKATKRESLSSKATQDALRKLNAVYNQEVVYMPYGNKGKGFYLITKEREP